MFNSYYLNQTRNQTFSLLLGAGLSESMVGPTPEGKARAQPFTDKCKEMQIRRVFFSDAVVANVIWFL
jgi:hypothetical protein